MFMLAAGTAAILTAASAASAGPDTVSATARAAPTFNGEIFTVAYDGNTVYVGGDFTTAYSGGHSSPRNHLAAFDATTGALLPWAPAADARVRALTVVGGTVYIGGGFSTVNGLARRRLAAVTTAGTVTNFVHTADNTPYGMASDGTRVYVGGTFTTIDGQTRSRLAAFDVATGALVTGWNPAPNDRVDSVYAYAGRIYVGGLFTQVNGKAPARLAALDPTDAHTITAFKGVPQYEAIGVFADATGVYVAEAGPGGRAAAYTSTGTARWTITTDGNAQAIAVLQNTVYVGGHFASVCKTSNTGNQGACLDGQTDVGKIFAVDLAGVLQSWNTNIRGNVGVHQIAVNVTQHMIGVGGDFATVGGVSRVDFAEFS